MGKSKKSYYAVNRGHIPGVYSTWEECEAQVKGVAGAKYRKFNTLEEAESFANGTAVGEVTTTGGDEVLLNEEPKTTSTMLNLAEYPSTSSSSASTKARLSPYEMTSLRERQETKRAKERSAEDIGSVLLNDQPLIVYTDGACRNNGKPNAVAGIGVYWGPKDSRNLSERCPGAQTNNRAELLALIRCLETIPPQAKGKKVIIKTDSKYAISCVTLWIAKWEREGWTKIGKDGSREAVKNSAMIRLLASMLSLRRVRGEEVRLEHVYGHNGEVGNEGADRLAVQGAGKPRIEQDLDWDAQREIVEREIKLCSTVAGDLKGKVEVDDPKAKTVENVLCSPAAGDLKEKVEVIDIDEMPWNDDELTDLELSNFTVL